MNSIKNEKTKKKNDNFGKQNRQISVSRNSIRQKQTMHVETMDLESDQVIDPTPTVVNSVTLPKKDTIKLRNKMIQDIIAKHPDEKLVFAAKKPNVMTKEQLMLVPLSGDQKLTMERALTSQYLVITPGCTHNGTHTYSSYTSSMLEEKSIKYIHLSAYGDDYPIVSPFKLNYCKKCIDQDHELLIMSKCRGQMKFVTSESTRSSYSHAPVPNYVRMDIPIFEHNDDVWVNLTHTSLIDQTVDDIRSLIVYTTRRKNYIQVITLPPPFEEVSTKFDDFGPCVFITSLESGFDDEPLILGADVDSEFEESDGDDDLDDGNGGMTTSKLNNSVETMLDDQEETETASECEVTKNESVDNEFADPETQDTLKNLLPFIDTADDLTSNSDLSSSDEMDHFLLNVESSSQITKCDESLVPDSALEQRKTKLPTFENILLNKEIINQTNQPNHVTLNNVNVDVIEIGTIGQSLMVPVTCTSTFMNNHLFLCKFVNVTNMSLCNNKLYVECLMPTNDIWYQEINDILLNFSLCIEEITDITMFYNYQVTKGLRFSILPQLNNTSLTTENTQLKQNAIAFTEITSLDEFLHDHVTEHIDESLNSVVVLLEKAYLQQMYNKNELNIYLDFYDEDKCRNIDKKDIKCFYKSQFAYNFKSYALQPDSINRDISLLLLTLKYNSLIPTSYIMPTKDGILISS